MKLIQNLAFLAGILILSRAPAGQLLPNEIRLTTLFNGAEAESYATTWDEVAKDTPWSPDGEQFPVSLQRATLGAINFLQGDYHITNHQALSYVAIKRVPVPPRRPSSVGVQPSQLTNRWFIVVSFYEPDPETREPLKVRHNNVVMLLDGAITRELTNSFKPGQPPVRGPISVITPPSGNLGVTQSVRTNTIGDCDAVLRPGFIPPSVKWMPLVQPLPVDLTSQISKSKEFLRDQGAPNDILLCEAQIQSYIPINQPPDGQSRKESNDWQINLRFEDQAHNEYSLYLLLDGTVLCTSTRIKQHPDTSDPK